MAADIPAPHSTLGALEIGVIFGLFLFGIVTAQVSVYYQRFPDDPLYVKSLVAAVWFLDAGHSILISCLVYTLTVAYYGRAEEVTKFTCLNALILFGAAITWTEQVFFSHRIYKIMNRSYLGLACFFLSTARLIACLYLSGRAFSEPTFHSFTHHNAWLMSTVLLLSASVDVIIAVSLCYFLINRRDRSLERTTRVLDRLIAWTLQTGLMTSITATVMVICFQTMPKNFIWLGVYMFLGKLYSISLLASLNNRSSLRNTMAQGNGLRGFRTSIPVGTFSNSHSTPGAIIPSSPLTEKSTRNYSNFSQDEDTDVDRESPRSAEP